MIGISINELFVIIVLLGMLAVWIYALADAIGGPLSRRRKTYWLIVLMFLPFVGALAYLAFGRRHKAGSSNGGDFL